MRSLDRVTRLVAATACLTTPEIAEGQSSNPANGDSAQLVAAESEGPIQIGAITISGYLEASYAYATGTHDGAIAGRLYDRFNDQFTLNTVKLAIEKPYAPDRFTAGFRGDVLLGQNATVLQSAGLALGNQGDITQLFVTLNIPTANGNGVQVKVGKMVTLLGVEVIETVANPNWSVGNQFVLVENFTNTGASVEHKFNDHVDAQLRVINGWDVVQDNNRNKSVMGRVGLYPDSLTTVAVVAYYGPEEVDDQSADRSGAELIVGRRLRPGLAFWLQGDYGREDANPVLPDPTRAATWHGVGAWVSADVRPTLGVALRGDYVDDRQGARTNGILGFPENDGQRLVSGTVTFNVRTWEGVLVRPELRYDRSNLGGFDGKRERVSVAMSAAVTY
jgi:hypothetical protein